MQSRQALERWGGAEPSSQGKYAPIISNLRYNYIMPGRVEILNETVCREIAALPAEYQGTFVRLGERHRASGPRRAWANRT